MAKKVSINAWEKLLPNPNDEQTITVHSEYAEDTIEVSVKRFINTEDYMDFVKIVTEACFDMNTGDYIPQAYDVAFKVQLIQQFTNLNFGKSVDRLYALASHTDIIKRIYEVVGISLIVRMQEDITRSITWEIDRRMKSSKADELYDALIELLGEFSGMADAAKESISDSNITDLTEVLKKFKDQKELVKAVSAANKEK